MKKTKVMKPTTSHQEILLFTGTTLASREFSSREENNNKANSAAEELEKACWAGLLCELLPEVMNNTGVKSESFIWNILNGKNFLYITLGPHPVVADNETTLDPYFYMMSMCEN